MPESIKYHLFIVPKSVKSALCEADVTDSVCFGGQIIALASMTVCPILFYCQGATGVTDRALQVFRKAKETERGLSASEISSGSTSTRKTPFALSTGLSRTSITVGNGGAEDAKGAIGLNLLFSPDNVGVDLIFVHGLGGGSRKTWSKTPQRSHYWPHAWLPEDAAFQHVRIHSYGYDSDYMKGREDCLNIHHFGKSFLGALATSPCLSASKTPIIAVGHSMGGLVIKKAYLLARQDAAHTELADRFAAIHFLATPHRGSDSARLLKNILRVASKRAYVGNLERNSEATQVINDEFRHVSSRLELWSFYETQVMKFFGSLIVDPESAVLGYREEKQVPMNADHRLICKFDTPLDPNYIALRDALASTVARLQGDAASVDGPAERQQLGDLKKYIGISTEAYEDDLSAVLEARIPGSCQWLDLNDNFNYWKEGPSETDRVFWIKGKPGSGKSVLAGYVIDQLRKSNETVSFFFFKHGDEKKSHLRDCLLSLAFQMATTIPEGGKAVLQMRNDNIRLDTLDERALWRVLFTTGILRVMPPGKHFWVIDALDECSNPSFFFNLAVSRSLPMRILIVSRDTMELELRFPAKETGGLHALQISASDTTPDLRLMIESHTNTLEAVQLEDRLHLLETVLERSQGSFLWTLLVLKEFERCHSKKEISHVLSTVPAGMEPLYRRILDAMSRADRGKALAKAILIWATCASRPMTTGELSGALSFDVEDEFPQLEQSISALCGDLVVVDMFGKVRLVHETAREFLLSHDLNSEFAMNRQTAHTRMGKACLKYLAGDEMKPPRTSRRVASANRSPKRSDFAAYASTAFSHHLSMADPLEPEPLYLAQVFFKANVLSWIEAVATSQDLSQLPRASKHLTMYIDRCAAARPSFDTNMQFIQQGAKDLTRVSAKFAAALTQSPSSIYSLIPPFCPNESMIRNVRIPGRRLEVVTISNDLWNDKIATMGFNQGKPSAVCYGGEFLAVGLTTGQMTLYYATSFQEYKTLNHGESIMFIRFKGRTDLVATCGLRSVKIWDTRKGTLLHKLDSPRRPLGMEFKGDTLLVASHKSCMATWNLGQGALPGPSRAWYNTAEQTRAPRRPPCAFTMSVKHGILAVAYPSEPITMWDMEEEAYIGSCGKKLSNGDTSSDIVVTLLMNPNPAIELLAVAYLDGDLALIDPFVDEQLECFRANCQTLAASPDGRLLAAGGADGLIQIYEFDTFKLLYRVKSTSPFIKQLAFSRDNIRLADIRGAQCTVWEPEVLLRDSLSDGSSEMTSTSIVESAPLETKAAVTAMIAHPAQGVIFCGKDDGEVAIYDRKTATYLHTVHKHKSAVRILAWSIQRSALMSIDASNKIAFRQIRLSAGKNVAPASVEMIFQTRLESEKAIIDIMIGDEAGKFAVSTRESIHLFTLDGEHKTQQTCPPGIRKWMPHPRSPEHMMCVDSEIIRFHRWHDLAEVAAIPLSIDTNFIELKSCFPYTLGREHRVILEFSDRDGSPRTSYVAFFDAKAFDVASHTDDSLPVPGNSASLTKLLPPASEKDRPTTAALTTLDSVKSRSSGLAGRISHIIGLSKSGNLVFLDRCSWVCSTDLREPQDYSGTGRAAAPLHIHRHFFIPSDWFAGRRDIVCGLVDKDILLTRGGDLAIIREWAEHSERVLI